MSSKQKHHTLIDEYRFPGCRPMLTVKGRFGDPRARIITLVRRQKKQHVGAVVVSKSVGTIASIDAYVISHAAMRESTCRWRSDEFFVGAVMA